MIAQLTIDRDGADVVYSLLAGDDSLTAPGPSPEGIAELRRVSDGIVMMHSWEGPDRHTRQLRDFVRYASVPTAIERAIRRWVPGQEGGGVVCITIPDPDLAQLPWEILPEAMNIADLFVVRRAAVRLAMEEQEASSGESIRVLVAGWANVGGVHLAGIERELVDLPKLLVDQGVEVTRLPEATQADFVRTFRSKRPSIVHLAPAGISTEDGVTNLVMPGDDGDADLVPAAELASILAHESPRLLVLNACAGGLSAAPVLAHALRTTVVGWVGWIEDKLAYDFALFFHQRLVEGAAPTDAVRAFTRRYAAQDAIALSPIPVVWVPSLEAISEPLFPRAATPVARTAPRAGRTPTPATAAERRQVATDLEVQIDFEPLQAISPSLLLNGQGAINRLTLNASQDIDSVRLSVECDAGSGVSTVRQTLDLAKGPNPVADVAQMRFPILYHLIEGHPGRRFVNFVVTAVRDGAVLAESTRAALMMDTREWMDREEAWPFIPSFVQPNAVGVLQILGEADKTLKKIGSPTESFDGYQTADVDHIDRQARAIFVALHDYTLSYFSPPASPVYIPGADTPAGQLVRFPDEVLEHKRGTCHDLALLFASCLEHIGVFPLVILIRGHTFLGYWRTEEDHHRFWERHMAAAGMPRSAGSNGTWILDSLDELRKDADADAIRLVEATKVTDRNADFEEACAVASDRLAQLDVSEFDVAVDVAGARYQVQPIS